MPNLTKLIAIIAITTGFGLAGCKNEPAKTQEQTPVAKPTEPMAKPEDTTAKPTAATNLPAECAEYKAAIEKIGACDKVPQQQRDALKQAYDTSSAAWATVPADGKAALAASCKSATDAIKTSATACP